jgi:hypothetical protein
MQPKRDATKAVVQFHARWLRFLLHASPQTMRRVAHELAMLEEENRNFRDGAIFRLLRHETEFVIQDVGRTSWTSSALDVISGDEPIDPVVDLFTSTVAFSVHSVGAGPPSMMFLRTVTNHDQLCGSCSAQPWTI